VDIDQLVPGDLVEVAYIEIFILVVATANHVQRLAIK